MPFFAVNVLAGRSRLSVKQFWLISQVGMLPATYLLVRVGTMVPEAGQISRTDMLATLWPLLLLGVFAWFLRLWMADPDQDSVLQKLLPEVADREARECIALDHQRKCLLSHRKLTADPVFTDNVLALLLQSPRYVQSPSNNQIPVVATEREQPSSVQTRYP